MRNVNKVTLLGRLTADPALGETKTGIAVTTIRVATNYRIRSGEGASTESVEFHDVTCWGVNATNVCQYLKKGQPVYIEGRLRTKNWVAKDGETRYKKEIVAQSINFLSGNCDRPGQEQDTAFEQKTLQAA